MERDEIAWLAGIVEGEGCITFTNANSVVLSVKMTDLDVIERLKAVTGVGHIYRAVPEIPGNKKALIWQVTRKEDVEPILIAIKPWMGQRRAQKIVDSLVRLKGNRSRKRREYE